MSTVGVSPSLPPPEDAPRFPSYNHHYHQHKGRKLCDLYRAHTATDPPVFRTTHADWTRRHCQYMESQNCASHGQIYRDCGSERRRAPLPTVPAQPRPHLSARALIGQKESARWLHESTPDVTSEARAHWNHFLCRHPERYDIQLPLEEAGGQVYIDAGYALRYLRPFVTHRLGLDPLPSTPLGERPTPALPSPHRALRVSYALTNGQRY
ncbi:uncharacterized protein LOC106013435 [Aplysia californica]|uniref:Uncharacterized protein LOC106013435 n=1 Tax=Aplysia californica TaxID=6500 RepID=A0ABM1ABQ0_APLCA|nr:uncharacterized protein LOC106013435 [Aplysia californica]